MQNKWLESYRERIRYIFIYSGISSSNRLIFLCVVYHLKSPLSHFLLWQCWQELTANLWPLLRKQQQHSINGRMHTGVRPGKDNKHFFWCFQELRWAFLPSEIFDKLPEAPHRQSKINECRLIAEIASTLPPLGILSLLWCWVAVIAAELDSLRIIIHIHTYRQFGISN